MISAETIAELEARGLLYILGVRERTDKLVRDLVLDDPAPFVPLVLTKRKKDIEYEAKAVALAGRRYIVCRNREEMKKDAAARAAILAALERQLKKGDKSLVGNKGYRRFLATPGDDHFAIDRAKAEEDAKFDGVFVLRTNVSGARRPLALFTFEGLCASFEPGRHPELAQGFDDVLEYSRHASRAKSGLARPRRWASRTGRPEVSTQWNRIGSSSPCSIALGAHQSGPREQPQFHDGVEAHAPGSRVDLAVGRSQEQRLEAFRLRGQRID